MNFSWSLQNKKVKEFRKNQGYTIKELSERLKIEPLILKKVDELKLKEVPEPLRSKLSPILRGDINDKIPWL